MQRLDLSIQPFRPAVRAVALPAGQAYKRQVAAIQSDLGYDLVLNSTSPIILFFSERIDLTQLAIERLAARLTVRGGLAAGDPVSREGDREASPRAGSGPGRRRPASP